MNELIKGQLVEKLIQYLELPLTLSDIIIEDLTSINDTQTRCTFSLNKETVPTVIGSTSVIIDKVRIDNTTVFTTNEPLLCNNQSITNTADALDYIFKATGVRLLAEDVVSEQYTPDLFNNYEVVVKIKPDSLWLCGELSLMVVTPTIGLLDVTYESEVDITIPKEFLAGVNKNIVIELDGAVVTNRLLSKGRHRVFFKGIYDLTLDWLPVDHIHGWSITDDTVVESINGFTSKANLLAIDEEAIYIQKTKPESIYLFKNQKTLTQWPERLFNPKTYLVGAVLGYAFSGTNLTAVGELFFDGVDTVDGSVEYWLAETEHLTSVDTDLFLHLDNPDRIVIVDGLLMGSGFNKIPNNLLDNIPNVESAKNLLRNIKGLERVPDGLFDKLAKLKHVDGALADNVQLNYVPINLLYKNPLLTTASELFKNSVLITNAIITDDFFKESKQLTNLSYAFDGTSLTYINEALFGHLPLSVIHGIINNTPVKTIHARVFISGIFSTLGKTFKNLPALALIEGPLFSTNGLKTTSSFDEFLSDAGVPEGLEIQGSLFEGPNGRDAYFTNFLRKVNINVLKKGWISEYIQGDRCNSFINNCSIREIEAGAIHIKCSKPKVFISGLLSTLTKLEKVYPKSVVVETTATNSGTTSTVGVISNLDSLKITTEEFKAAFILPKFLDPSESTSTFMGCYWLTGSAKDLFRHYTGKDVDTYPRTITSFDQCYRVDEYAEFVTKSPEITVPNIGDTSIKSWPEKAQIPWTEPTNESIIADFDCVPTFVSINKRLASFVKTAEVAEGNGDDAKRECIDKFMSLVGVEFDTTKLDYVILSKGNGIATELMKGFAKVMIIFERTLPPEENVTEYNLRHFYFFGE